MVNLSIFPFLCLSICCLIVYVFQFDIYINYLILSLCLCLTVINNIAIIYHQLSFILILHPSSIHSLKCLLVYYQSMYLSRPTKLPKVTCRRANGLWP